MYDDDLRRRLVARAAEVMAQTGPSGLVLRPLAAAEGTSTTAVYTMFGDRAGLIDEVGRTAAQGFAAAQRAVPVTDDPYEDLIELGRAYRNWALAHRTLYLVLMTPSAPRMYIDGPMPQSQTGEPLRDVIRRLVAARIFPDIDVHVMLGTIWSSVHGFVMLEFAGCYAPATSDELDAMYEAHLVAIARGWRVPG